jgi:hypothetical protein
VDVRAVRLEPVRVPRAQLALLQPALTVGVPGEPGSSGAAVADGALCRILAGDYLDTSRPFYTLHYWTINDRNEGAATL